MAEPTNTPEVKTSKKSRPKPKFITSGQLDKKLDSFKSELIDAVKGIVTQGDNKESVTIAADRPDAPVSKAVSDARALVEAAEAGPDSNNHLPSQYQRVFEKYFDPKDGFEARLNMPEIDDEGRESGGITFSILVPLKFSNAGEAYLKHYKVDVRTRALRPDNVGKGIVDWCIRVAKNLHYNRNLRSK